MRFCYWIIDSVLWIVLILNFASHYLTARLFLFGNAFKRSVQFTILEMLKFWRNFLSFKKANGFFIVGACFVEHEFREQKLFSSRPVFSFCQAPCYKIINLWIVYSFERFWKISVYNFSINLCRILTFSIWSFLGKHF